MNATDAAGSVSGFFESYRQAFEQFDAPAIADHFTYPGHMTADAGEIVLIHWALHDRAGRVLYDFEATYTLAKTDDTLRITALSHNEIPRYRDCLARQHS